MSSATIFCHECKKNPDFPHRWWCSNEDRAHVENCPDWPASPAKNCEWCGMVRAAPNIPPSIFERPKEDR